MKYLFFLALILNFLAFGAIFLGVSEPGFPVVVKYNVFVAQDIFGTKIDLFSLSFLGLLILIVNAILALFLSRIDKTLPVLISIMTCLLEALILLHALIVVFTNSY